MRLHPALALPLLAGFGVAAAETRSWDDAAYLKAAMTASVHQMDSTLADVPVAAWIQQVAGESARMRWEVNDCGEQSGSPSDSARDLPVCAEASVVLSGGRQLWIQILVGSIGRGPAGPPALWFSAIDGPDSSVTFRRLSDIERYIARDSPVLGNTKVYVDQRRNVHVVTSAGKDVCLTKEGRFRDPKLSPDGESIGMLALEKMDRTETQVYEPIEVASEVWLYRGGRVIRRIVADGFIRDWGFANKGSAVAVYSGGLHFAGFYVLYDLETGRELARAKDPVTGASPKWVRDLEP